MDTEDSLMTAKFCETVKTQILSYSGHVIQKPPPCLEQDLIQGKVRGQRRRRRPRTLSLEWI